MQKLSVQIEAIPTAEGDILSAWFTLPIDEELFSERLGVDAESNDYRIIEKELPFAEEVDEDTTVDRLNDFYYTYESLPADLKEDYGELMCHFTSLEELHQHRHDIIHYSWCKNMADVAKHLLDNAPAFAEIDERLVRYFDFEAYCKKDWRAGRSKNCDRSQGSLFHRKSQEILVIFGRIERFSIYVLWRV